MEAGFPGCGAPASRPGGALLRLSRLGSIGVSFTVIVLIEFAGGSPSWAGGAQSVNLRPGCGRLLRGDLEKATIKVLKKHDIQACRKIDAIIGKLAGYCPTTPARSASASSRSLVSFPEVLTGLQEAFEVYTPFLWSARLEAACAGILEKSSNVTDRATAAELWKKARDDLARSRQAGVAEVGTPLAFTALQESLQEHAAWCVIEGKGECNPHIKSRLGPFEHEDTASLVRECPDASFFDETRVASLAEACGYTQLARRLQGMARQKLLIPQVSVNADPEGMLNLVIIPPISLASRPVTYAVELAANADYSDIRQRVIFKANSGSLSWEGSLSQGLWLRLRAQSNGVTGPWYSYGHISFGYRGGELFAGMHHAPVQTPAPTHAVTPAPTATAIPMPTAPPTLPPPPT